MNVLKILAFLLLIMASSLPAQIPPLEAGVSQTLAKWRAANYSDTLYRLNLTIEKMSPVLKGTIEVSVKSKAETIILDWRKIRGREDASTVSNVTVNDQPAKYEESNEHLVFREGVRIGENIIKLNFTSPILTSGSAITRYVDKEDGAEYIYSLFVPSDASTAFPVFDQPDLKARFILSLNLPETWKAISNNQPHPVCPGPSESLVPQKKERVCKHHFFDTKPISTYVFAFAAGDFAEFRDESEERRLAVEGCIPGDPEDPYETLAPYGRKVPKIYVRKSQAEKFKQHEKEVFRLNREGVKFLESYFDYKFPFPKYDLVLIPEFPFGGMEHAGATFLREASVIFPTEPTKNDYVSRANVIFHEAAHQWFGDTVTMKWFDDLWLKEGFAEFMAYKTLEKVMPEYNAWKIFYERNKQAAYLTDATEGTTPIYQEIPNLSAAKSAYGNIVYRKAPSFLKQAEFYLDADKFQTAVRQFLKNHQYANAEWTDLVKEFEAAGKQDLKDWANAWVKKRGMPVIRIEQSKKRNQAISYFDLEQRDILNENGVWQMRLKVMDRHLGKDYVFDNFVKTKLQKDVFWFRNFISPQTFIFPNYQDYGYGIFLLDEKSRAYVLANIQSEKDDFLRAMMWGSLWDSVRETELAPADYVRLAVKNINIETDESTIQTLLSRVSTAMNYYLSDKQRDEFASQIENLLLEKMRNAPTVGQKITFYRAFLNAASSENARTVLKDILSGKSQLKDVQLKTKDKFDIVTRLLILGDNEAPQILATLEKTETSDEAKRYAYAAKAGIPATENKAKFWNDFINNKEISESWIESAFSTFNSIRHSELTLPYLEKALAELPNLKRNRKIFFVNGWLGAFISGQKSEAALNVVNKFLADNPNLDRDLRLKILENADGLKRAVKIRAEYEKKGLFNLNNE